MWVLKLLPDWIFYCVLLAGLVGLAVTYFLRLIPLPFIYMYKTPIQLASIVAIAFGTFMSGAISNEAWWQEKVKELEEKIAISEKESKEAVEELTTKLEAKTNTIQQRKIETIKYIEVEREKIDATCTVPQEFIFIINKAAEQPQ